MPRTSERGAVAVEFAIVAPVLVMLLLGIMEFSRAYNAQATLSAAAREAVRVMAISNSPTDAKNAAKAAAASLRPGLEDAKIVFTNLSVPTSATCAAGTQIGVTITYTQSTLTGIAGAFPMTGKGAMLCGG
ncbi:Flp pilus assembly protein TadG [Pseudarthrobacter siccitolerans]|uniref:Flp pilus assembly protein TadG n=1 Tax=Pseudarthrobacter siccitolerans TaxID=861266 RepID=A0ABU0PIB8_9MICC|nr:TadE family protein [Pseudarthrobacter siccitolerans]MDQ0673691.1 Flp pilus assembly protein TadG [Pseudarthrobacter siccitolerans]